MGNVRNAKQCALMGSTLTVWHWFALGQLLWQAGVHCSMHDEVQPGVGQEEAH